MKIICTEAVSVGDGHRAGDHRNTSTQGDKMEDVKSLSDQSQMTFKSVSEDPLAPSDTVLPLHEGLLSTKDSALLIKPEKDQSGGESDDKNTLEQIQQTIRWLQTHPVLGAVIWIFGKVTGLESHSCLTYESDVDAGSTKSTSSKRLSWNDERGGTLAEYFEDPRPRFDLRTSDGELLLREEGFEEDASEGGGRPDAEGVHLLHHCTTYYNSIEAAVDGRGCSNKSNFLPNPLQPTGTSYSPNGWGWYVNMTPPQEFYPSPDTAEHLRASNKFIMNK